MYKIINPKWIFSNLSIFTRSFAMLSLVVAISCLLQSCAGCSNPNYDDSFQDEERAVQPIETSKVEEPFFEEPPKKKKGKNTVYMLKDGGVYHIPVYVNDIKMKFIFDTGAGMISISSTEAGFLYKQGTLTDDDFLGTANFMDANGDITPGLIVRLKTVQIGNRVLENVEASVVDNNKAPLLLGQSALSKFGKISIDYGNETLSFED